MYQTAGNRRREDEVGGLGRAVEVQDPVTHARCEADERRIRPVIEPDPGLLVRVTVPFLRSPGKVIRLHHAAYAAYRRLKQAAEVAGVPPSLLTIVSGYRSIATQKMLWERALNRYGSPAAARVYVAPPGGSPHHSGRAIDFYLGIANDSANIPSLRGTPAYRWLVCNATRFGFTPYSVEPWHWEFNPAGLNPAAPAAVRGAGYPIASIASVRPSRRAQLGYFGEPPRTAKPPRKAPAATMKPALGWTIAHTAHGRFTLAFRQSMHEPDVIKLLFVDGRVPPGFRVEQDPNGKGARWMLFIPTGLDAIQSQASNFTQRLLDALNQSAMDNILALTPAEAAANRKRIREYNERISKEYLPFLGMTFGEALKTYGLGWFEKGGYFVWIGVTTDGTELQAVPLSKIESTNRDMRWYLNKNMSIRQAGQEIFDRGVENLRMLVVGMMGA